jgi:hypothetical protein
MQGVLTVPLEVAGEEFPRFSLEGIQLFPAIVLSRDGPRLRRRHFLLLFCPFLVALMRVAWTGM